MEETRGNCALHRSMHAWRLRIVNTHYYHVCVFDLTYMYMQHFGILISVIFIPVLHYLHIEPLVRFMLASGEAINQTIVYPPSSQKSSASFEILIYTTLRVTSVLVERSDGKTLEQPPVVEFLVHPPGEIIAKYRVTYPWLSSDLDGEYSITVENVKGMVSHTLFNILKAEGRILIYPLLYLYTKPNTIMLAPCALGGGGNFTTTCSAKVYSYNVHCAVDITYNVISLVSLLFFSFIPSS